MTYNSIKKYQNPRTKSSMSFSIGSDLVPVETFGKYLEIFLVIITGDYFWHLVGRDARKLLNFLQCTDSSPQQRCIWSKVSIMPSLTNPDMA